MSKTLADLADKHLLYEQAVQCVEAEIDMVDASFESIRSYAATTLREDFCGTAQTSIEWVQRRRPDPTHILAGIIFCFQLCVVNGNSSGACLIETITGFGEP